MAIFDPAIFDPAIFDTGGGGSQTLTATAFASVNSFGAAIVTAGAFALSATLFADGDTFGAAVVSVGPATLNGTVYTDPDTFGAAIVAQQGALFAALFVDPNSFGAADVSVEAAPGNGYVAPGYWQEGYVGEGARPRGDDASISARSSGARERFWRERAEEWLEDRLERIEEVARAPKKTRRNFADNVLERAEAMPVLAPRVDALAELMASLTVAQPDYTALAMQVAEWRAQIAAERRKRRDARDIEALIALGVL